MSKTRNITWKTALGILIGVLALAYLVLRTARNGNDINVYLFAAQQLLDGENIYTANPFNFYLYSPLFALLLSPLTFLKMSVARVLWMLINVAFSVRIFILLRKFVQRLSKEKRILWSILVILLSAGFLNHNFMLGQLTILILWLTLEGLVRISRNQPVRGAVLLALGMNFKIIPLLAFAFLGMRGHLRAILYLLLLIPVTLFLPGLFIGQSYNIQLLQTWKSVIHPGGERFAFEDNDGCQSLNAVLPAYLYDFEHAGRSVPLYERNVHYPRRIASLPTRVLERILTAGRILVLLILLAACLPGSWLSGRMFNLFSRFTRRIREELVNVSPKVSIDHLFWQLSFFCLATLLIFPHQMKYSMLFCVPAGGYLLYYFFLKRERGVVLRMGERIAVGISAFLLFTLTIMGRDIIGSHLVDILDYYHFMGLSNLVMLPILWYCHPDKIKAPPASVEGNH